MVTLKAIASSLQEVGLTLRGAFHPTPEDGVPGIANGKPVLTLVLAGNVGPAMWEAFRAGRNPMIDLLDDWSEDVLWPVAKLYGGKALFPFHKPYLPFQRWAQRAEACHASPLGMLIHAKHGLWHGYRGALTFAERLVLPDTNTHLSPCNSCSEKPCLNTCPVGAFMPLKGGRESVTANYDIPNCVQHLGTPAGEDCMQLGCRARRACPEGKAARYQPEQAQFHMRAFLNAHHYKKSPNG